MTVLNKDSFLQLSPDQQTEYLQLLKSQSDYKKYNKIKYMYPDEGPLRRDLYVKHIDILNQGANYNQRCAFGGNRTGKSQGVGAYEVALHATGQYPDWWEGKRFNHPVQIWACGDTAKTVRDVNQLELFGEVDDYGTGMIPKDCIVDYKAGGLPNSLDTLDVKHVSGGTSKIGFKSYEGKRKVFQGTAKHMIWLDEEPPMDVYQECLLRTLTTDGIILLTFTPLTGMSQVVLSLATYGRVPRVPTTYSDHGWHYFINIYAIDRYEPGSIELLAGGYGSKCGE